MDDILRKIVTESESSKLTQIVSQSHQAIEILCDKMSLMRFPMNEIRDKCFQVFQSCLSNGSKNPKLIQLSVTGMQLMIRNQIYWSVECKEDENQLPSQLIECISSTISQQNESIQMEMLSILSEMSLTIPSLISLDNIEDIIEICCKLSFQSSKHQMAIEATASQSCHQFLKYCLNTEPQTDSCVDEEMIPLLDLIINKLKFSQNDDNIAVLLKCVHYFFITIPDEWPLINDIIVDIVWKTLIPTLIKHLSPIDMSECSSKSLDSSIQSTDGKQLGRGSESLNKKQNFNHKKTIFKITSELLRLFGRISSLRPALESLFHRILLYPPVPQRLDALKWIQELLKKTSLVVIASIEPLECFGKSSRSKDLDLLHIILDSLEECSLSSDPQICLQSISAVVIFLRCLQTICNSFDLKPNIIEQIDRLYPTLIDSDFEGFDVRNTKFQSFESKDYFESQTKVSLEILKKRIIGFDASEEPLESSDQTPDPPKKQTNDESIRKSLRNFKVEAYKSKLKEILGSKSTDSNTDSQDIDVLNRDNYNENKDKDYEKQESIPTNGANEEVIKETIKLGSRSTSYEEVEEYRSQKSIPNSNSSFTEGPEYEDCVEQIYEKRDSQQMTDFPQNDIESIHYERNNARRFISALKIFLPKLLSLRTSIEADQALQLFASNYCTDLFEHQKCISNTNQSNDSCMSYKTIINADGIYLSTYSTLLLNLKLIHSNFYNNSSATIPLTEQEFIEELHSSGILIYISSYWLAELYQRVLSDNLLENAGYKPLNSNIALINLLTDIDGLDSFQPGAQQLSDYKRLEKAVNHSLYLDITQCAATHKLVRRLLTAFWDTILGCLGTVFRVEGNTNELSNAIVINSLLGNDKSINIKKEMITNSLDGLQMSAKLCIQLGLQSRCDTVFELLALSVIETKSQTNETLNKKIKQIRRSVIEVIRNRQPFSLHSSHVLSLQVLLSCSLEIGSHCTSCWRYVFKCCQYIMELEHHYFTSRHSSLLSSTRTSISSLIKSTNKQTSDFYTNFSTNIDSPSMPGINESEELNTQSCIEQLIAETNSHSTDCVLKDKQLERVIDILSHLVDLLFEDAANKLNLRSLHSFLTELCVCSREQLNFLNKLDENSGSLKSLLLFRLSDVMLRCAKSGRPLMHFMKCWSVVASHLVEAATHSDHSAAKKSISTLHDIINVILCSHNELPHFHFNEALFKPFENLLLLELCDTDIQELIISSICEFVEGTTEEIRSGWRSLFGALRGIRLPQICNNSDNYTELEAEKVRQLRVILDIFEAFLHTDNLQVFANAALDCLLCLIKLIKTQQIITNQTNCDESIGTEYPDLCLISLKYLDQFSSMLRSMYQMPGCPIFSNSRLLRTNCPESKLIDITNLPDVKPLVIEVSLERLDRTVRILQIWFILVEEFTQAIEKCEQKHRNTAIEILFNWFKSLFEIPGPNFAIYCINHILMPFLQRMTRQTLNNPENNITGDQISLSTLRHLYGLTADLVVSGIQLLNTDSNGYDLSHSTLFGLDLMLRQSLLVYIECLNGKYNESVAKLSCACIRHILLSVRTHFDHNLWQTTIDCLWTGHKITLQSLEDMVNVFTNKSQYFFDDFDQIQVISKRDPKEDSEQLSRLAQQIFLLDAQRNCPNFQNKWSTSDLLPIGDNRSFIFLINSSNNNPLTISFRELIIQLTCHWLLLQTISVLILSGIEPLLPNLNKLIDSSQQLSKPAVLSMDINQCQSVLSLLDHSYRIAFNFDSKLGLKFLMQKISRCEVPTNLYQFSSLVWSVRFVVNLFIINDENLINDISKNDLKQSLSDLCDRYSEQMKDNDSDEITIDDICHQSLHFLQASNEELMNIIGNKHLIENTNTTKEETIVGNNVNQIEGKEEVEEEEKKRVTDSDEERAETPDNSIKIYSLATEKKIDSMVAEYKKYKTQFSPIPPNANSSQPLKKATNEKIENSTEKDSQKVALKDSQAFTALWSEIIGYAIDLHMSLPLDRFNQSVPLFLPSVQSLIINCNNKHLRSRISQWITRIAENCLKNNEINA